MKIAIVGPSPVPFTIGGIENLQWGLCDAINKLTPHQCELIKLPSRELDFWGLIETYYSFYKLDVSHFDMVIYSKYPAWMVQHPNGICYMAHCLRGLYDTYHLMNLPYEIKRENVFVDSIIDYMEQNYLPNDLDYFFEILFELKKENIPEEYFLFPGPFIRTIIHYLDRWGLQKNKNNAYYSISKTVCERKEYFPQNVNVNVVYPPTTLKKFSTQDYKYIFMVSRLDAPKRIDMLIRAMKHVKTDVKLYIAGTGPEKEKLEKLAGKDKRIEFLGFVNDEDVENYYSNSLVIPYFPYDEDYGLITIEAMLHRKPVITTVDSGGPTEFVHNGETGYVVESNEVAIAEKIDYFAKNPEEAKRMGNNAYNEVKDITWKAVVNGILGNLNESNAVNKEKRKKITVVSTFPIYPPQGGGQARTYNLYKSVAEAYDVEIVSFASYQKQAYDGRIADGLKEIRIPQSKAHFEGEMKMQSKIGAIPISDIAMITEAEKTKQYCEELNKSILRSDMVIVSHPYLYYVTKKYMSGKKFIYEAQDVEYLIKRDILPKDNKYSEKLISLVYEAEKECCVKSEFIMTCSEEDKLKLKELYGVSLEKIIVVPNGVDTSTTKFVGINKRIQNKNKVGLGNQKIGLFMGSWHGPNLEACEYIFKIAEQCPDVVFLLMGSQCMYFEQHASEYKFPENVGFLGLVSEEEKLKVFNTVDFALNPMVSGSGTNLKMFDYMSAGIPVITTKFGTRGIENTDGLIIAEIEEMHDVIRRFVLAECSERVESARKLVEDFFDWRKVAQILINKI